MGGEEAAHRGRVGVQLQRRPAEQVLTPEGLACLIQQCVDILFRPFFLCSPFPLLFTCLELAVVMTLINNIWLFFFLVR